VRAKTPDLKRRFTIRNEHRCTPTCFDYLWPSDVEHFCDWLLDRNNIAKRVPNQTGHQRAPMQGRHTSIQGKTKRIRGSDLSERIYVAFEMLRMSPEYVNAHADGKGGKTFVIERTIESRLGHRPRDCGRSRPKQGSTPKFQPFEKTGTIYSVWRKFRERHPWKKQCPDPIVALHLQRYIQFCWLAERQKKWLTNNPNEATTLYEILGEEYTNKFVLGHRDVPPSAKPSSRLYKTYYELSQTSPNSPRWKRLVDRLTKQRLT
jgi:hypothetical protein